MSPLNAALNNGIGGEVIRTFADPPTGIISITPADDADLAQPIRGFMVAVAGNVKVRMIDGSIGTYPACQPGGAYGGCILRIYATGTTATGIVGLT